MQPGLLTVTPASPKAQLIRSLPAPGEAALPGYTTTFLPEMETALTENAAESENSSISGNNMPSGQVGRLRKSIWAAWNVLLTGKQPSAIQFARGRAALAQLSSALSGADSSPSQQTSRPDEAEQSWTPARIDSAICLEWSEFGRRIDEDEMLREGFEAAPLVRPDNFASDRSRRDAIAFPWHAGCGVDDPIHVPAPVLGSNLDPDTVLSFQPEGAVLARAAASAHAGTNRPPGSEDMLVAGIMLAHPPAALESTPGSVGINAHGELLDAARRTLCVSRQSVRLDPLADFEAGATHASNETQTRSTQSTQVPSDLPGDRNALAADELTANPPSFEALVRPGASRSDGSGLANPASGPQQSVALPVFKKMSAQEAVQPVPSMGGDLPPADADSRKGPESAQPAEVPGSDGGIEAEHVANHKTSPIAQSGTCATEHPARTLLPCAVPDFGAPDSSGRSDSTQETSVRTIKTLVQTPDEDGPETAAPLGQVAVKVEDHKGSVVHLRFTARGNEVHLAARTANAELDRELALGLPDLRQRLEDAGMAADLWAHAGETEPVDEVAAMEARHSTSSERESGTQDGQRGKHQSNSGGNGAKWMDLIEDSLDESGKGVTR